MINGMVGEDGTDRRAWQRLYRRPLLGCLVCTVAEAAAAFGACPFNVRLPRFDEYAGLLTNRASLLYSFLFYRSGFCAVKFISIHQITSV